MDKSKEDSRKIHVLGEDVSRRIAAGEVIERPFSVVRELLDNSLDASADEMSVYLRDGGNSSIRVVDNGCGMQPADLKRCYLSHATSKISKIDDLDTLSTLGFRGEALSSMAACARLEVVSAVKDGLHPAHRLVAQGGKLLSFAACQGKSGTIVDVSHVFFNMPARKKFLKRSSAETMMCKIVFLDKAMPFPGVVFKLFIDGELKLFFERQSLLHRVTTAYNYKEHADIFSEVRAEGEGFSLVVVCAGPDLNRKDRKHIQVFVNKRRVYEYSLVQAVEYGFKEYLPGGLYPVCFVFLQIDPRLVDFNIHPAKKEVRIKNLPLIHQKLVALLKSFFAENYAFAYENRLHQARRQDSSHAMAVSFDHLFPDSALEDKKAITAQIKSLSVPEAGGKPAADFSYLGQLWKVFLVFSTEERVYFVDQHAAHERLLFDRIKSSPGAMQKLLFPISFEVSDEELAVLETIIDNLKAFNVKIQRIGENSFEIQALPEKLHSFPESELIAFLRSEKGTVEDLSRELYARAACRLAIKEGEEIDELTACELFKEVLSLTHPRCPHGRPLFYSMSKDQIFKLVGRNL
ncbi:MAG: DNA mismatch repair endonuclease MutL [Spirochaetales bacterium]|nr:DNA mismatch repair endonuclease MutL [Spirochaetales bacterium]